MVRRKKKIWQILFPTTGKWKGELPTYIAATTEERAKELALARYGCKVRAIDTGQVFKEVEREEVTVALPVFQDPEPTPEEEFEWDDI